MSDVPTIVIESPLDLWRTLRWRGLVALRLPLTDALLQAAAEERFNFWRTVCGCQLGALLLLATLGYRLSAMFRAQDWNWSALVVEGAIALLAALTGKVLAIAAARLLLLIDVAIFQRRIRQAFPATVES